MLPQLFKRKGRFYDAIFIKFLLQSAGWRGDRGDPRCSGASFY